MSSEHLRVSGVSGTWCISKRCMCAVRPSHRSRMHHLQVFVGTLLSQLTRPLQVLIGNYLALNLLVAVLKTELSRAHAIQRMKAMEVLSK